MSLITTVDPDLPVWLSEELERPALWSDLELGRGQRGSQETIQSPQAYRLAKSPTDD